MKKIFIISASLLLITLIFLGVYNFVFNQNKIKTSDIIKNEVGKTEELFSKNNLKKEIEKKGIAPISDIAALGLAVKKDKIVYYSTENGTIWESETDGMNKRQIESKELSGIKSVEWSQDRKQSLVGFTKDQKTVFSKRDIEKQIENELKEGTDFVVWDSVGARIIYKYYDFKTKKRSLNIANSDGSNWLKLADIDFVKIDIAQIPQTSLVSFWNYPDSKEESKLQTVSAIGGTVAVVFSGKFGADYLWSNDGKKALVSSADKNGAKKITTGIFSLSDQKYQEIGIPTVVQKAVWSRDGKMIYYALPGGIPDGAILPEDYLQKKFMTSDTFWKVDIETGEKTRIVEPQANEESFDAQELVLTSSEDALLFINRVDNKVYRINL